jgi:hypothetical protein
MNAVFQKFIISKISNKLYLKYYRTSIKITFIFPIFKVMYSRNIIDKMFIILDIHYMRLFEMFGHLFIQWRIFCYFSKV